MLMILEKLNKIMTVELALGLLVLVVLMCVCVNHRLNQLKDEDKNGR